MLKGDSREPIFPKGAFGRFLGLLAIMLIPALAFEAVKPDTRTPEQIARAESRAATTIEQDPLCIVVSDKAACAAYWRARIAQGDDDPLGILPPAGQPRGQR